MKKFHFIILLLLCRLSGFTQGINVDSLMRNMPDLGENICMSSIVVDESMYPKEALNNLYSNMGRLISRNGVLNLKENIRFFLATNYNVISKDIIPGIPTRISEKIQFNFIIGDALTEQVFSSMAVQAKGVGINENKALITAIQSIKWNDEALSKFVVDAKKEIVKYYTNEAPSIFKEAELLSKSGKQQEAIGLLISIPSACPMYKESMRRALVTYQEMIDNKANVFLRKAKAEWSSSPDRNGAEKAVAFIDSIPLESKYETEVNTLLEDINKRVASIDKREWDFKKQQYSDSIRHLKTEEQAAKMKEYAATHPYSSKPYKRSAKSDSGNSKGLFGGLIDKWNAQPTWKKVLIGGGIGLAAAGAAVVSTVSSVAGALLARTMFHVILPIPI